jgi:hypothetical protein
VYHTTKHNTHTHTHTHTLLSPLSTTSGSMGGRCAELHALFIVRVHTRSVAVGAEQICTACVQVLGVVRYFTTATPFIWSALYIHMYVYVHVYVHICTCVCAYMCVYAYAQYLEYTRALCIEAVHTQTHIHTHKHTPTCTYTHISP